MFQEMYEDKVEFPERKEKDLFGGGVWLFSGTALL